MYVRTRVYKNNFQKSKFLLLKNLFKKNFLIYIKNIKFFEKSTQNILQVRNNCVTLQRAIEKKAPK